MDLSDDTVAVVADVEFESYLCFAVAVADDVLVARLLAGADYSAEERVEYRVEDCRLAALIEPSDEYDSVRES